jgi:chromosome partitioning protein
LSFGINPDGIEENMYDIFTAKAGIDDVKISINDNIDLVPANGDMNFVEYDILTKIKDYPNPFEQLKKQVDEVIDDYDYIFIDTPPSIGLVTLNALRITEDVIIPFVPETFSTYGLRRLIEAINDFKEVNNPNLKITGIVAMMIQPVNLHTYLMQDVRQWCFQNDIKCFDTSISKSIRFAEAVAEKGCPAVWYDRSHKIVSQYFELAREVLGIGEKTELR